MDQKIRFQSLEAGYSRILTHTKKEEENICLFSDFCLWTKTFQKEHRLVLNIAASGCEWLCKSVLLLFVCFLKLFLIDAEVWNCKENKNTFSNSSTKQSLNAGGPQLTRTCSSSSILRKTPCTTYHLDIFHNTPFSFNSHHSALPSCLNSIWNLNSKVLSFIFWSSNILLQYKTLVWTPACFAWTAAAASSCPPCL